MESDELRGYLIREFRKWFDEQRELHLPKSRGLSGKEKSRLDGYFDVRILDSTRIVSVDRILNPDFYTDLKKSGMPVPMDFTQAIGFTIIDCLLIRTELLNNPSSFISTLFHELVHVVQFDIFGPTRMIELYTDSLIQGGYQYYSVPFERQAYALTDKFAMEKSSFSVREIVAYELKNML